MNHLTRRAAALPISLVFLFASLRAEEVKPVFESPVLTSTSPERVISAELDMNGIKELYLVVSDEGSLSCDWADWITPEFVMGDGSVQRLTEIPWKIAETAYGEIRKNQASGGGPMLVEGKQIENGIGTHAASTISVDVPAGAVRFRTKVSIDDGGMIRDGKPSDASVKFRIFTQKPPPPPSHVPLDRFTLPDDLEITVWAESPMFFNPTNIDFDEKGRMWVAEGVNYRGAAGKRPEGDRIVVLEDTDGDGKADKSEVFLQDIKLASPLGVAVFEEKVVVSQPPDLLIYTDSNRDGKFDPAAEKSEVLLTGFGGNQHDHSLHSVTAGPDGLWYWNQGNTGAEFTDRSGRKFFMGSPYMLPEIAGKRSDDGNVWIGGFLAKMHPDGTDVKIIGHNFRNSYEQAVTSFGDIFQSDNDDPPACRVTEVIEGGNAGFASVDGQRSWNADQRPGQDTPTAEWRQEDPGVMPAGDIYGGGSPTGVAFYENGALGEKWNGLLLACEAGKNVIYGYFPKREGAGFKLERFDFLTSNKEGEFAGSDFVGGGQGTDIKTLFRPSDVCVGPDGAIYVADWFDARVGGHATLDREGVGTIYRIAPKGFKPAKVNLDLSTTEGQIQALSSPSPNVRQAGFVRLKQQGEGAIRVVTAMQDKHNVALAGRSLFLLAQLGPKGVEAVERHLESSNELARLVALRALRAAGQDVLPLAKKLVQDPSAAVRREVALSLRGLPAAETVPLLAKIAAQYDGKDAAYLEALGLGATGRETAVAQAASVLMKGDAPPENWSDAWAGVVWRLRPPFAVAAMKARAVSSGMNEAQRKQMLTAIAFTATPQAAGAMIELAAAKDFPLAHLANWWLMNRKGNDWKDFGVDESLKALGLYDPSKVTLTAAEMPPSPTAAFEKAEAILALHGDAERGKARVAVCYTCHKIGDAGVNFGPDLTAFGQQQPPEVIVRAIVEPSADLSHGYEGTEIQTTDGLTITGMLLSEADPLIVKCMGGVTQTIPKDRVRSMKKMPRSLMYEPQLLGLDPQGVADIAAYLKSLK